MKLQINDFEKQADQMTVICENGRDLVLRPVGKRGKEENEIPEANFMGTGLALCGVIDRTQTYQEFKESWIQRQIYLQEQEVREPKKKTKKRK